MQNRIRPWHGGPAVDQLIPSLVNLLAPISPAFRKEVFQTFRLMFGAWIVCLGRRTVSRVFETTGRSESHDHSASFRLVANALWNWDEVMRLLLASLLQILVPGTRVWIVIDDTLCHKRGAKVAFGGIFLDAVLRTRKHKTFRFGNNWVLLGLVVSLPFRPDRPFCVPLLWRVYEKRGTKPKGEHRTKVDRAADLIRTLAKWLPNYEILVIADSADIAKGLLKDRPANVHAIGPICWKAALTKVKKTRDGQEVSSGKRLPNPREIIADDAGWPCEVRTIDLGNGPKRRWLVKVVQACGPTVVGDAPVQMVLIRDPAGEWRDEALVSTNTKLCDWEIISGYCKRWCVEVAFADAKQQLGFHDACVWKKESVERTAPMAWFVGTVVLLWYTAHGREHREAKRHRPWYPKSVTTFSDMLACCRLALWENWWSQRGDKCPANGPPVEWFLEYVATAA